MIEKIENSMYQLIEAREDGYAYRSKNGLVIVQSLAIEDDGKRWIRLINPFQVNIGADSRGSNLPEPAKEKITALIAALSRITTVYQKSNLRRIMK